MSIPRQDHQATFYDASFLAQDLFDKKDRYDVFRKKVLPALQAIRNGETRDSHLFAPTENGDCPQ